ncbi:hypothetical protein SANTM175S_01707 [Streptomyces antimycoticus]
MAIAPEGVDVVLHLAGDGAALADLLRPGGRLASATGLGQDDVKGHDVTVAPDHGRPRSDDPDLAGRAG